MCSTYILILYLFKVSVLIYRTCASIFNQFVHTTSYHLLSCPSNLQAPSRGPCVFLYDAGTETEYPAQVLTMFTAESSRLGSKPVDFAFVQWYTTVGSEHSGRHPLVPACEYVILHDSFALVLPEQFIRPALLVPNFDPKSPREAWKGKARDNKMLALDGTTERPGFFVVNQLY